MASVMFLLCCALIACIAWVAFLYAERRRLQKRLDETNEMYCDAERDLLNAMEQWEACERELDRAERREAE